MSDNLNISGPDDGKKINMHQAWERSSWAKKLGVTEDKLQEAVDQVGTDVEEVEKHLKK